MGSEVIAEQDQRRVTGVSVAKARNLAREGAEARQVDEREAAPPDEPAEVQQVGLQGGPNVRQIPAELTASPFSLGPLGA
jgi:hypothetical protein